MTAWTTGLTDIAGLVCVALFLAVMLLGLVVKVPRPGRDLRPLHALRRLRQAIFLTVESGQRLHVSLGRGLLMHQQMAVGMVGLRALERLVSMTAAGDRPTIVTAGTGPLGILSRSTLHSAYETHHWEERYRPTDARVTGLTPFAYAAGAGEVIATENVAANFFLGAFGPEVALLADQAAARGEFVAAGSDSVLAQAVLYAVAEEPLIGEEAFAAAAYLGAGGLHATSLIAEDVFRWLLIALMVGGALFKLVGGHP